MPITERQERAPERPFALVTREEIVSCRGSISALEEKLVTALSVETGGER
jgi:hypothetical protein